MGGAGVSSAIAQMKFDSADVAVEAVEEVEEVAEVDHSLGGILSEEHIVWEFHTASGFKAFDSNQQSTVESQYQSFLSGSRSMGQVKTRGKVIHLDFKRMVQNVEGSHNERAIQRRVSGDPPSSSNNGPPSSSMNQRSELTYWEFSVKDGFQRFDGNCHKPLEAGYQDFLRNGKEEMDLSSRGKTIIINFKHMNQHMNGSNRFREIRRVVT